MTIYVGNLFFDAEVSDLEHLFAEYGQVSKCSLPLDRDNGRKRGFAFVEMANEADETKAINDLQDVEWQARSIRVNRAAPRTGSRGVGHGRRCYGRWRGGRGERRGRRDDADDSPPSRPPTVFVKLTTVTRTSL